jgi:hypothetical protein
MKKNEKEDLILSFNPSVSSIPIVPADYAKNEKE